MWYQGHFSHASLLATHNWAAQWSRELRAGDVIGLDGPLGAGKTTLIQALGKAFDVKEPITSPTFALLHNYEGRTVTGETLPILHLDWYRLEGCNRDAFFQELDEYFQRGQALIFIEWASLAPDWVQAELTQHWLLEPVVIDGKALGSRQLTVTAKREVAGLKRLDEPVPLTAYLEKKAPKPSSGWRNR